MHGLAEHLVLHYLIWSLVHKNTLNYLQSVHSLLTYWCYYSTMEKQIKLYKSKGSHAKVLAYEKVFNLLKNRDSDIELRIINEVPKLRLVV